MNKFKHRVHVQIQKWNKKMRREPIVLGSKNGKYLKERGIKTWRKFRIRNYWKAVYFWHRLKFNESYVHTYFE